MPLEAFNFTVADPTRLDSKNESPSSKKMPLWTFNFTVADPTRLELATSAVTGQRSNQLSYESTCLVL